MSTEAKIPTDFITADKLKASEDLSQIPDLIASGKYSEALHIVKTYLAKRGVYVNRIDVCRYDPVHKVLIVSTCRVVIVAFTATGTVHLKF